MSALLGQGEDFQRLVDQAQRGTMHHGVLITGPRGTGKSTAAREIASVLLRDTERVTTGAHPDLHLVEIPEDREDIPVDLVRQLREQLLRRPVAGGARVVILDPADRLNEQGQNALLKTLEEPGSRTWLLLPTGRPEALLDTVRSRVAELRMRPLPADLLQAQLQTLCCGDDAGRAWAASLARGSLGLAQQLLEADLQEVGAQIVEFLSRGQGATRVARLALAGTQGRPQTLERARLVLCLCREIFRSSFLQPTAGSCGSVQPSPQGLGKSGGEGRERACGELPSTLANADLGNYPAAASLCTPWIERLFEAEQDLDLRLAPEPVLAGALQDLWQLRSRSLDGGVGSASH